MAVGRLFAIYYMLMIPIIIQRRFFYDLGNKQGDIPKLRETEDRVKGIEAGCDDFISKPVKIQPQQGESELLVHKE
ncbi:MAG: hypothetical protein STSR0003_22910 [Smithella sp.]